MDTTKSLTVVNREINKELADPAIVRALLATTFKDFDEKLMKQAIFEGIVRGFTLKEFLEKDVYAIKYGSAYSLITSIGHARKIGMRSGVVGKSAPDFVYYDGGEGKDKIESCSVTIKRRVGKDIGEFTAMVFFEEYSTGKNQWVLRPRTMIAKVAEMHALRMAAPGEMSKVYIAEEFDKNKEEAFDSDDITDDTIAISTGDDHSVKEAPEIPESEEERLNVILGLVVQKWPKTNLKDMKEIKTAVADFTQIEFTPVNYPAIITALR